VWKHTSQKNNQPKPKKTQKTRYRVCVAKKKETINKPDGADNLYGYARRAKQMKHLFAKNGCKFVFVIFHPTSSQRKLHTGHVHKQFDYALAAFLFSLVLDGGGETSATECVSCSIANAHCHASYKSESMRCSTQVNQLTTKTLLFFSFFSLFCVFLCSFFVFLPSLVFISPLGLHLTERN